MNLVVCLVNGQDSQGRYSPAKTVIYQFNYKMILTSHAHDIYQYYEYYNWLSIDYWNDQTSLMD